MGKLIAAGFGFFFNWLFIAISSVWGAHINLFRNLIMPRNVIFPTLKDKNKHTTGKSS